MNWTEIDKHFSEEVAAICDEIINIQSFPVRISITEIIRRVGHKGWIEKRERKLSATSKVITAELESLEDFMIRKVLWAKQKFRQRSEVPTELQLKTKAVVRNRTSQESKKIQQIIKKSIEDLRNTSN